jgi:heme-degrading monooxygenase HmoA
MPPLCEHGGINHPGRLIMFCVIFEVHPKAEQWDTYLELAKRLRPELERMDGFIDNVRYRSLTREGWILSVSSWRDEKALVRWRVHAGHHAVQEKGRGEVFLDYHLRIAEVVRDTAAASALHGHRVDVTATGAGSAVVLIETKGRHDAPPLSTPSSLAAWLGWPVPAEGLVDLDVFEAVLTPGDFILLSTWRDDAGAQSFERTAPPATGARVRRARVIRDYGMFDRREAPQYYPAVARRA